MRLLEFMVVFCRGTTISDNVGFYKRVFFLCRLGGYPMVFGGAPRLSPAIFKLFVIVTLAVEFKKRGRVGGKL